MVVLPVAANWALDFVSLRRVVLTYSGMRSAGVRGGRAHKWLPRRIGDVMEGDSSDEHGGLPLRSSAGSRDEPELEEAFDRIVDEGRDRLGRPLLPLVATGLLGGVDVAVGVLAYLVVEHKTGQPLLASAAFTIGFIALLLARSELFTENFLVPVTALASGVGTWPRLLRLWLVTLATNLAGGFVMAGMIVVALPDLRGAAAANGLHYATLGISWRSLLLAVLAGAVITLMTRMQHSTDNTGVQIVAAVAMSFLLVGAQLFHSILDSIVMFAGLLGGEAHYSWGDWSLALAWSSLGNLLGGIGLVTSIRLLRVSHRVEEAREEAGDPAT
jgi:formate/nitrite transporter FocA (FNT family)